MARFEEGTSGEQPSRGHENLADAFAAYLGGLTLPPDDFNTPAELSSVGPNGRNPGGAALQLVDPETYHLFRLVA